MLSGIAERAQVTTGGPRTPFPASLSRSTPAAWNGSPVLRFWLRPVAYMLMTPTSLFVAQILPLAASNTSDLLSEAILVSLRFAFVVRRIMPPKDVRVIIPRLMSSYTTKETLQV